jgi:Flp pilus assembly protein TadG
MRRFISMLRRRGAAPDSQQGVVSLEFAVIAPVLITMTIGAYDVGRAVIFWQETQTAAQNIAFGAATDAAAVSSQTSDLTYQSNITPAVAQNIMSIIYGVIPEVRSASYITSGGQFSVTLTGIVFQAPAGSPAGTPLSAYVIWSVPLTELPSGASGFSTTRTCGLVTQLSSLPETSATMQSIPTSNITYPSPVVVADVHFRYKPLFFWYITGPIDFWESYFQQPSTGLSTPPNPQEITFDGQSASDANVCQNEPPPS